MKVCAVCSKEFTQFNSMQTVCSAQCARRVPIIARKKAKEEKRVHKEKLEAVQPRSYWLKLTEKACNAFIRTRDAQLPCISCGRYHQGQWHAGHFYSVGARPELRFDEQNIHKQCQPCNMHLHGNLALYREGLIERIGAEEFAELGRPRPQNHYTIDTLRVMAADYRVRTRELSKRLNNE